MLVRRLGHVDNEPEEQEKAIKFNTLVADLVMYQTTLDMSLVLNQLRREGQTVHRADYAGVEEPRNSHWR
ncbi:Tn3 family transposase [Nonomuraea sp. H19]|uniref:Tn3 family transposase n=1 Tax=Nonomuraea sp. H19 TaxID=3452206 RepID=UPI003F8C8ECA